MATIKEIAALAGVSRGTVDRVLNKRGAVSEETAAKIQEIADSLGYRPNRAGLALATQKKKLKLGFILFNNAKTFFDKVYEGIAYQTEQLSNYGCSVIVKQIDNTIEDQLKAIDELVNEGVNGLVLVPYNSPIIAQKIDELWECGIPVVTTNSDIDNSKRLAYVGSDYFTSGSTAGGLMGLMTSGETNVGIVYGSNQILCHTRRIAGFKDCISKKYPHIHIIEEVVHNDDEVESYKVTKELLESNPSINALYFVSGGVYGGCKAIHDVSGNSKITVISHDKVDTTKEMVLNGTICATICQQPFIQGSKPLLILFEYLMTGENPEKEINYVAVDIRTAENI